MLHKWRFWLMPGLAIGIERELELKALGDLSDERMMFGGDAVVPVLQVVRERRPLFRVPLIQVIESRCLCLLSVVS